jgi:hypothetical protein
MAAAALRDGSLIQHRDSHQVLKLHIGRAKPMELRQNFRFVKLQMDGRRGLR